MEQLHKNWLYALSAPMVALNRRYSASYTSPQFYSDYQSLDIKGSWGISNRGELLELIGRMTDNGHAEQLSYEYYIASRYLPNQWQAYRQQQELRQQIILDYVAATSAQCGEGGIKAWDLGRMSFLCRIGVLNGWITEDESLWLHYRLAVRATHYYHSWFNYCAAYMIGRNYWLGCDEPTERLRIKLLNNANTNEQQQMALNLYTNSESPIQGMEWYLSLDEMVKPQSLEGLDWQ